MKCEAFQITRERELPFASDRPFKANERIWNSAIVSENRRALTVPPLDNGEDLFCTSAGRTARKRRYDEILKDLFDRQGVTQSPSCWVCSQNIPRTSSHALPIA